MPSSCHPVCVCTSTRKVLWNISLPCTAILCLGALVRCIWWLVQQPVRLILSLIVSAKRSWVSWRLNQSVSSLAEAMLTKKCGPKATAFVRALVGVGMLRTSKYNNSKLVVAPCSPTQRCPDRSIRGVCNSSPTSALACSNVEHTIP